MLIRFLKKHISWKEGDEANVDTTQGNYLIRCRVAEPIDANPKQTEDVLLNNLQENKEELPEENDNDIPDNEELPEENSNELLDTDEGETLNDVPAKPKKSRKKTKPA